MSSLENSPEDPFDIEYITHMREEVREDMISHGKMLFAYLPTAALSATGAYLDALPKFHEAWSKADAEGIAGKGALALGLSGLAIFGSWKANRHYRGLRQDQQFFELTQELLPPNATE